MLTGREARTFPPPVLRALFFRIFADSIAEDYRSLVRASVADIPEHLDTAARQAFRAKRTAAAAALTTLREILEPGDPEDPIDE